MGTAGWATATFQSRVCQYRQTVYLDNAEPTNWQAARLSIEIATANIDGDNTFLPFVFERVDNMAVESEQTASEETTSAITERINVKLLLGVFSALVILYVYLPVLSLFTFSFNSGGLSFPFDGITLQWYSQLFADEAAIEAIFLSLKLAAVVTVIGTLMSTATAVAYLYGFPGSRGLLYLLIAGIVVPGITYGLGSNIFLSQMLGLTKNLWLAVPVHVVWAVPFATIFLIVGIPSNLAEQDEAARAMGAGNFTVFRKVILPQISLSVVGAAIIVFTLSYNEGTRSLLLLGQDTTMPIQIFSVSGSATLSPQVFALGSVTAIFSTLLLCIAGYLLLFRGN
jgi:putative spermidine/putrescine transport system permease protein